MLPAAAAAAAVGGAAAFAGKAKGMAVALGAIFKPRISTNLIR